MDKKQFLKIAKVKNINEFYQKFPDEDSFMKAHGKEFKKALRGSKITKAQGGTKTPPRQQDFPDNDSYQAALDAYNRSLYTPPAPALTGNFPVGAPASIGGEGPQLNVSQQSSQQQGFNWNTPGKITGISKFSKTSKTPVSQDKVNPYVQAGMDVLQGVSMIKAEKDAVRQAKQSSKLMGVEALAATSTPRQPIKRNWLRPEDSLFQPEQMFPSYGVGTNVLAENGAEITNTFAPGNIYNDMGYEPLNDSSKVKQFQGGGDLGKIDFGEFAQQGGTEFAGQAGEFIGTAGRGPNAGSRIGSGVGQAGGRAFGSIIGGPVGGAIGGMLGKFAGGAIGGVLDRSQQKIDSYNRESAKHVANMMGQYVHGRFGNYLENGGWVSHDWQPQLITQFGEHNVHDLLKPDETMDTLRAGGHLKAYTPPTNRGLQTFAMGGELQVDDRGDIDFMGYNPVTASTGASGYIGISRGPSHDNGGFNIDYNGNKVEIEGGETIGEKKDGGAVDNTSLNVLGNLKLGMLAGSILDNVNQKVVSSLLKGRNPKDVKYKHLGNEIAKKTKSLNKQEDKYLDLINSVDNNSKVDLLKLTTGQTVLSSINMQYKELHKLQDSMMIHQEAVNKTAEEMKLVPDDLARGKVKIDKQAMKQQAKYGMHIPKAQGGSSTIARAELKNVNEQLRGLLDLLASKNYDYRITSSYRPGATTAQGKPSRHASGEALDVKFPELDDTSYNALLNDPDIVKYMLENGLTAINEYDPNTQKATGATGPHIHFGLDKGTALSDKFRTEATAKYPNISTTTTELPKVSKEDYDYIKGLYEIAKKEGKGDAVLKFQQEFHRIAPEYAKSVLSKYPTTTFGKQKGYGTTDLRSNLDKIFGKRTEQYMAALDAGMIEKPAKKPASVDTPLPDVINGNKKEITSFVTNPYKRSKLIDAFNQIVPYLRPTDAEPLDPNQLMGEMYALGTNQLEPVQAQLFQPELSTPYDISLQDVLNQNQADYNATQKQVGYNPSAMAILNAQKYAANEKVLGEQFRMNQAERQRVYEGNRNLLNQSKLQNLGILDKQYERQDMAKAKTKATTQAALNSISSKIAQNKLENRTLQVYENMYNYRYSPNFRAQNMNPWWQPDIPNVYTSSNDAKYAEVPVKDANGNILYYKQVPTAAEKPSTATPGITNATSPLGPEPMKKGGKIKKNNLNSSIVKALKNI